MAVILAGQDTSDRNASISSLYTILEAQWPADGTGVITTINVRVASQGRFVFGIWKPLGNSVYFCRGCTEELQLDVGVHSLGDLSLPVETGDLLGVSIISGSIDCLSSGGYGAPRASANYTVEGAYAPLAWAAGYTLSLGASGTTTSLGLTEQDIYDELDSVVTNYVNAVQRWQLEHPEHFSYYVVPIAVALKVLMEGVGGGDPSGGATLAQMEALIGTTSAFSVFDKFDAQNTLRTAEYEQVREDIGLVEYEFVNQQGHLAITEGNLDTAITVAKNAILNAIGGLDAPALADIQTAITNAQNAIIGDVDSKAQAVIADVNGNVDLEHTATRGAIALLNNLSEAAVSALVSAAVATLTGEIGEGAQLVLDALGALQLEPTSTGYPGPDGVTFGSPASFTNTSKISTPMDGVLVELNSWAEGKGILAAQGVTNVKYIGWLVFLASDGACDELQWLGPTKRAYTPKQLTSPSAVVICGRDGVNITATPFTINAS